MTTENPTVFSIPPNPEVDQQPTQKKYDHPSSDQGLDSRSDYPPTRFADRLPVSEADLIKVAEYLLRREEILPKWGALVSRRVDMYLSAVQEIVELVQALEKEQTPEAQAMLQEISQAGEAGTNATRASNKRLWQFPVVQEAFSARDLKGQDAILKLMDSSGYKQNARREHTDYSDQDSEQFLNIFLQYTLGWVLNKTKGVAITGEGSNLEVKRIIRASGELRNLEYGVHLLDVMYAADGIKDLDWAELTTIMLHDILEKGGAFRYSYETNSFEHVGITQDDFVKRFGVVGEFLFANVSMLTEFELNSDITDFASPEEVQAKVQLAKTQLAGMSTGNGLTANPELKPLLSSLQDPNNPLYKKAESLLIEKMVDFGNLSWGLLESGKQLRKLYDNLQSQEQKDILLNLVVRPRITTEILDRFKADAATIVQRSVENAQKGKWSQANVVAYFERYDCFMSDLLDFADLFGLTQEYKPLFIDSQAQIELTKQMIKEQLGFNISEEKIEDFRKVRGVVTDAIVAPITGRKIEQNMKIVSDAIEKI